VHDPSNCPDDVGQPASGATAGLFRPCPTLLPTVRRPVGCNGDALVNCTLWSGLQPPWGSFRTAFGARGCCLCSEAGFAAGAPPRGLGLARGIVASVAGALLFSCGRPRGVLRRYSEIRAGGGRGGLGIMRTGYAYSFHYPQPSRTACPAFALRETCVPCLPELSRLGVGEGGWRRGHPSLTTPYPDQPATSTRRYRPPSHLLPSHLASLQLPARASLIR